ncbi:restriction endonuclease subunit S [Leucobacter sp. W1478]|uniref:restriction endonuclease subunit S n=1 Tax=Leucobacter sp. W1478 TaxID=3439065 RepID=UPI003F33BF8F
MSRIDELIAEHCPDGVDFFAIADLFDLKNGYTPSKSNALFWQGGVIPWFRMEDIRENGGVLDASLQQIPEAAVKGGRLFPANSLLVATSATIGEHALITVPHLSNQRFTSLSPKPAFAEKLDMKFAYYYGFVLDEWCRNNVTTSSFASVDMNGFKRFKFPVPPLEVQREIARILDTFSALEAELEAELEARKQQYEHYRAALLGEHHGGESQSLGEIFEMRAGTHVKAAEISETHAETHPYRCFGGNGVRGFVSSFNYDEDVVFIGRQGALCGNVHRAEGRIYATEHAVVVTPKAEVDMSWAFHKLTGMDLNQYKTKSAQPGLAVGRIKELIIPLPPLDEQRRIVAILDKFDALVNDLNVGLPAELQARRQQHEYYRDKLLTFEELPA